MSDETIQTLEDMKATVKAMESVKGKQALITKLSSSILFLTMHKVDRKTAGLIVAARQKDIDNLGSGKEYKQAEIDWRAPKHLRDKPANHADATDDEIPF